MKLLLFFIVSLLLSAFEAQAYLDTSAAAGESTATAGEQNTSLYRLQASNFSRIKKMRQIDDILARNPGANLEDSQEIEDLLNNKKQIDMDTQSQLAQMYKDTVEITKKKNTLVTVLNTDVYRQLMQTAANSVKDEATAYELKRKIRRLSLIHI